MPHAGGPGGASRDRADRERADRDRARDRGISPGEQRARTGSATGGFGAAGRSLGGGLSAFGPGPSPDIGITGFGPANIGSGFSPTSRQIENAVNEGLRRDTSLDKQTGPLGTLQGIEAALRSRALTPTTPISGALNIAAGFVPGLRAATTLGDLAGRFGRATDRPVDNTAPGVGDDARSEFGLSEEERASRAGDAQRRRGFLSPFGSSPFTSNVFG